ncbi:MAG: hypothetical protein AAFX94_07540 [Myxococcota bacterium]
MEKALNKVPKFVELFIEPTFFQTKGSRRYDRRDSSVLQFANNAGEPHVLFIDPFPWNFEIRLANVAAAVSWAVEQGWSPGAGPTRAVAVDQDDVFQWLAEGQRHLGCRGLVPDYV